MKETITVMNPLQFKFYLQYGVKPIDLELGFDNKVCYIYKTSDTNKVWKLWQEQCKEFQAKQREMRNK